MGMLGVYREVMRGSMGYGLREVNVEGKSIINFSLPFDLAIANMCFKKREWHLITSESGVRHVLK